MLQDWMLWPHDEGFSAAQWLIDRNSPRLDDMPELGVWMDQAAAENDLNTRWLVVLGQKEQRTITAATLGERGQAYLMGYGATDGGDIPGYAGPRQQVFSAARGLRGYLTPEGRYYAPDLVGRPYPVGDAGSYTPQTIAEACSLLYTPWIHGLRLHERIWEQWFGTERQEGGRMVQGDVATVAREVVRRAQAGERTITIGAATFDARDSAMCSRFVRLCHGAVTGQLWPGWAGANAAWTERGLISAGHRIAEPVVGCVVAFNQDVYDRWGRDRVWNSTEAWMRANRAWGHVAIYIGDGVVAENSAAMQTRTLDQVGRHRISGYYAPLPIAEVAQRDELVVVMDPAEEWGRAFEVLRHEDGRQFVSARQVYEHLGYEVFYRDDRTYVKPTERTVEIAERIAAGGDA